MEDIMFDLIKIDINFV